MSESDFVDILSEYQFENGGFGGLCYEFTYQGPCLMCTEHAFRYLFYLKDKPSSKHPMIKKMMNYILSKYRPEIGCFGEMFVPEANDYPHVPWCGYEKNEFSPITSEDLRIKNYCPNGQASLAAFVALYKELVPDDLYKDIIKYPVEKLLRYYDEASPLFRQSKTDDFYPDDISVPYNMKCYQRFVACLQDKELSSKLSSILQQHPSDCMNIDESKWMNGFEELPCDIVTTPDSVIYPIVHDLVDRSLDSLIQMQNENGAWRLNFSFGEGDVFMELMNKYEMHFSMLVLAELKRFNRID